MNEEIGTEIVQAVNRNTDLLLKILKHLEGSSKSFDNLAFGVRRLSERGDLTKVVLPRYPDNTPF